MHKIPLNLLLQRCRQRERGRACPACFDVFNLGIRKGRRRGRGKKRLRKALNKVESKLNEILDSSTLSISLSPELFTLRFLFFTDLTVSGLGMVHVTIPNAIQSGRNVIMTCDYELENDDLYSVKWYKGKREFFRYTPKEIPSIKIFKLPGIRVDVSPPPHYLFRSHSINIFLLET